jgi:nitroimidazol reductase NimA-like FMN-containing flavoprotein (pyridoxamine 5'-phosphate oxidase superfamily)
VTVVSGWASDANALADFLDEPNLARLGTLDVTGDVHVIPVWFHWDGSRLFLGADAHQHKTHNVRRNRRAAVEIDGDLRRKRGILVRGTASVIEGQVGRAEYERISAAQVRRYQPDKPPLETAQRMASRGDPVVIVVEPDSIISWGR